MADFLQDYSGLAAAGSAFEGFAKGLNDAQDRKYKRMQTEAEIEAVKAKMQREKDQSAIEAYKGGVILGPDGASERPFSARETEAENVKLWGEGGKKDPNNPGQIVYDPNSAKAHQIDASKYKITSGNDFKQETQDRLHDAMDRREHERVLSRIASNKAVQQKLGQYQGLDNSLSIITQSDHITPEQIHEFQQAIRGNMGMKGQSGVSERDETYFKSAGLNAARWKEFLTGDPASIAKDSNLIKHFRQLAAIEQGNISSQYNKALSAASGGHDSMYNRRQDLKQDRKDAIQAYIEQIQAPPEQQSAPPAQPQGIVQPEKQGFLARLGGLLGGGSPSKAQAPADDLNADLSKMSNDQLKAWMSKHGGQ